EKAKFVNSDTSLFLGRTGSWKIRKGLLFLYSQENDSTIVADTLQITFKSEYRISVYDGAQYSTFTTKKKERSESIFTSIGRATLGMLALLFLGYLFSADRKHINWSLVIKGVLLQLV